MWLRNGSILEGGGTSLPAVRSPLPLALLLASVLLVPTLASAQGASQHSPVADDAVRGPLPALAGIPIEYSCVASLPPDHPALRRYPGEDAEDLTRMSGSTRPDVFVGEVLCAYLWRMLEDAGAHQAPSDVRLPARGVLIARLQRMWIEGSRVVEQRIGATIMPVSIPHWAVAMSWELEFAVEYAGGAVERADSGHLTFELSGAAEQDDYAPLRLGALLRGASIDTFSDLPRVLADDGHLGDLLFAVVESPTQAPDLLGLDGEAEEGFWQLLSTLSEQRHDAMAFYLASDRIERKQLVEMARWFVVNDPDVSLRRDALGWLLQEEDPDLDSEFSEPIMDLLAWLVLRERSSRVRAEAVRVLGTRPGEQVRTLLIAASTDTDKRVSDRAMSGLRKEPPPTAADLASIPESPTIPSLTSWTSALDGRVSPTAPVPQTLAPLALSLGGPAADTWLSRWAVKGRIGPEDEAWALPIWARMAREGSLRVRMHTLGRLSAQAEQTPVAELVEDRVKNEKEPMARASAIRALKRFDRPGVDSLLIQASRSTDPDVRLAAVDALTRVPGDRVDDRLEELSSGDPANKVRRRARRVLRTRAKEAWDQG